MKKRQFLKFAITTFLASATFAGNAHAQLVNQGGTIASEGQTELQQNQKQKGASTESTPQENEGFNGGFEGSQFASNPQNRGNGAPQQNFIPPQPSGNEGAAGAPQVNPSQEVNQNREEFAENSFAQNGQSNINFDQFEQLVNSNPNGAKEGAGEGLNEFLGNYFISGALRKAPDGAGLVLGDDGAPLLGDGSKAKLTFGDWEGHIVDLKGVLGQIDESGDATGSKTASTLNMDYTQDAPTAQPTENWTIPFGNRGYNTITSETFTTGLTGTGHSYVSLNDYMVYFTAKDDASTRQFAGVIGKELLQRSNAPTSAYQFLNITPELHIGDHNSTAGLLSYGFNIADDNLLPVGTPTSSNGESQIIADWNNDRLLGTSIIVRYTDDDNYMFGVQGMYGNYNRSGTAGTNMVDGEFASFVTGKMTGQELPEEGAYKGTMNVQEGHLYGQSGVIDGMMVKGDDQLGISGDGNFKVKNGLIAAGQSPVAFGDELSNKYGATEQGFAAGMVATEDGTNPTDFNAYINDDVTNVEMVRSTTDNSGKGSIGLEIEVEDIGSTGDRLITKLGTKDPSDNPDGNIYLGENVYGIGQAPNATEYVKNNVTMTVEKSAGFAAGAGSINSDYQLCSDCEYVNWGIWGNSATVREAGQPTSANVDVTTIMPYVTGQVTQDLGTKGLTGSVNYAGGMIGQVVNSSNDLIGRTGTFTATVDMDNRTITDYTANFADRQFGFAGQNHAIAATGNAVFANATIAELDAGSAIAGDINGALFGSNAENIAGNFHTTGGLTSTGIYAGDTQ